MPDLDDIIRYERECTYIDFKLTEYPKEYYRDFIVDIMAMANANTDNDRYIIIGVKLNSEGTRDILGVEGGLTDSATYQQIISSNVEPDIGFEYFPYNIDNKTLGIFKIFSSSNPPYMIKKANTNWKFNIGDAYIRKGDHQSRFSRQDFDRLISKKLSKAEFTGDINAYFDSSQKESLEIIAVRDLDLPSNKAKDRIDAILRKRKEATEQSKLHGLAAIANVRMFSPFRNRSYEERSTEELLELLADIENVYHDEDCYQLYETLSDKINICLLNKGNSYLEDATVITKIEAMDGLIVSPKIFSEPQVQSNNPFEFNPPSHMSWEELNYPNIITLNSHYEIESTINNLKHNIPSKIFSVPVRIFCANNLAGKIIKIHLEIHGKNLKTPIEKELSISIE